MKILPEHEFLTAVQEERVSLTPGVHDSCLVVFDVGERVRVRDLQKVGKLILAAALPD